MNSSAQEVITTDGGFGTSTHGTLSWTLGEVISETFSTSNYHLTQGFQQIHEGYLDINNLIHSNELTIFPNPFSSSVNLISNAENADYKLNVFDYQNKLILQKDIYFSPACKQLTIDLSSLSVGYYFFELTIPSSNKRIIQRLIKLKDDL